MPDYVRLKDIAHINEMKLSEDTNPAYEFDYIDISAINSEGEIQYPSLPTSFADAPSRARRLAAPGSIAVSTVRTYLRAIGQVPESQNRTLVFSTGFAILQANEQVDSRFLYYCCRSDQFLGWIQARSVGVSYPAINPNEIGEFRLNLPPREEQRRIADFLDRVMNTRNRLVSKRSQQRELLKERLSNFLNSQLMPKTEGGSVCPNFPWLPPLPQDRPLVKLSLLSSLQGGLTVDSSRALPEATSPRPYLRVANVQAGSLDLSYVAEIAVSDSLARRSTLRPGDVLMTEGGDLDKLGRGTVWHDEIPGCLHQNHVFAIRPDTTLLNPDYLALTTRSLHGRCYFESTGVKTTNLASTNSSKILSFRIPLPSLAKQGQIVKEIQEETAYADRLNRSLTRQVELLSERANSIVTAAVTGEIDVATNPYAFS